MTRPFEPTVDDIDREHDRQASARDQLRGSVDRKVGQAIEQQTNLDAPEERAQVESVARELKARSVEEIRQSERELGTGRRLKRIYQYVAYAFYVAYGLIGLMIGLQLIGARDSSGFMKFMAALTMPLLAPFRGVMPDPSLGSSQLMLSYVIALAVYALLHLALKGVFRILIHREGAEL